MYEAKETCIYSLPHEEAIFHQTLLKAILISTGTKHVNMQVLFMSTVWFTFLWGFHNAAIIVSPDINHLK